MASSDSAWWVVAAALDLSTSGRSSSVWVAARIARRDDLPAAASLYADVPFRQDISYLSIGERTNANGSKAFREALLAERWDDCVDIARSQIRDGAHMLDLNVDYVGRDGVADMRERCVPAGDRLHPAHRARFHGAGGAASRPGVLGGRAVINSANYEDGDGPDSRFAG